MMSDKKGQQFGVFGIAVTAVLALVIIGVLGTAGTGILQPVGDTGLSCPNAPFTTFNTTNQHCINGTNETAGFATVSKTVVRNVSEQSANSVQTVGTNLPSMGTVAVFAVVIGLLLGAVGYFGLRNS